MSVFAYTRGAAAFPAPPDEQVRRAIWPVQLARQIAYSLFARPISAGNDTYIRECLSGLASLRGGAAVSRIPRVAHAVDGVLHAPTREALEHLVHEVDAVGYATWCSEVEPRVLRFGRLRGAVFRRLLFVVGPGIGLGDEIAVLPFQRMLSNAFPDAAVEVYTSYPALWHAAAPGVRTRTQVHRPGKAYERIEELNAAGEARTTLASFVNFSGLEMLLPYRIAAIPMPALEYAVGIGRVDFLPPGQPLERMIALDPDAPSMIRARDALALHLLGIREAPRETPRSAPRSKHRDELVLLLNPLTSKEMPLTPQGWARLLRTVRDALPRRCRMIVRVYPGLSQSAHEIARSVIDACRHSLRAGDVLEPLVQPFDRLTSGNAVRAVMNALADADLLLGMDTFSAHLAARVGTPSVAICLTRNPLFWESAAGSFWMSVGAGIDRVAQLLGNVAGAVIGRPAPLFEGIDVGTCREALAAESVASASSPFDVAGNAQRRAFAALDEIWNALHPAARSLFTIVDQLYAWPWIRSELTPTTPIKRARLAGVRLADSMWFRLLRMVAS